MSKYENLFVENIKGIKKSNNDELSGYCPFHNDKTKSWSGNINTGLWICHAGCGSGNAYQFAERLGVDINLYKNDSDKSKILPTPPAKDITNSINNKLADEALKRIEHLEKNWDKLDIPSCWSKNIVFETGTGWNTDTNRISFTHMDKNGNVVNLHDHKSISHPDGDGSCKLYPSHLITKFNKETILLVTEGEKDSLSALGVGYQACTGTTGALSIPKDISTLKTFKNIVILYDNYPAGEKGSLSMAEALKRQNKDSTIKYGRWNPGSPEKYDVTDSIEAHGKDEIEKVIQNAVPFELPKLGYKTINARELIAAPFAKSQFIIQQILQEHGICLMAGSDGVGKSLLALQAGICMATGVSFLDFKVGEPRKVLLIQFELENGDLQYRFNKQLKYFTSKFMYTMHFIDNFRFMEIEQNSEMFVDQWDKIEKTIVENNMQNGVVIIDNLYTSTNLELSDNSKLTILLSTIYKLRNKYNVSMLLVTHHNKGVARELSLTKDQIRGGKMMTDFATNVIQFGDSSLNKDLRIAKITKIRSGDSDLKNIPFKIILLPDTLTFERRGIITNEAAHFMNPSERNEIKAIKLLQEEIMPKIDFHRSNFLPIVFSLGIKSTKSADNYLTRLISWGLIKRIGHDNYQLIESELNDID